MIDETVLKYERELTELLSPMGVSSVVSDRDSCYYLTVDGSKLYPTKEQWKERTGREFIEFVSVFIPKMYTAMEHVELNETRIEFKIGTIFDMMVRIKEYGNS